MTRIFLYSVQGIAFLAWFLASGMYHLGLSSISHFGGKKAYATAYLAWIHIVLPMVSFCFYLVICHPVMWIMFIVLLKVFAKNRDMIRWLYGAVMRGAFYGLLVIFIAIVSVYLFCNKGLCELFYNQNVLQFLISVLATCYGIAMLNFVASVALRKRILR